MQVVLEYEGRMRKMQWVPRFSYGRGIKFLHIVASTDSSGVQSARYRAAQYSSSLRESLRLESLEIFCSVTRKDTLGN
jgi:hypothetical protein